MSEPETPLDPDDDEGRFVEQVLLALDGQLGPEGDAALRARLAADAGKRRLFVRLCLQTQALLEIHGSRGQADVDLVAIDRVFCRRGKLRARVPEGAEGFVIASPESAVVDRGTEFAVNVDADGRSRVFVFEGLAEAALLDPGGSPKLTQIV